MRETTLAYLFFWTREMLSLFVLYWRIVPAKRIAVKVRLSFFRFCGLYIERPVRLPVGQHNDSRLALLCAFAASVFTAFDKAFFVSGSDGFAGCVL